MSLTLRLSNISLWGHHGMEEAEARYGGPFLLSIEATCDEPDDPLDDAVAHRVNYATLARRAREIFLEKRCALIEPLVSRIAAKLLEEFKTIGEITVSLKKLRPLMPHMLDHAEVSVTRLRSQPQTLTF